MMVYIHKTTMHTNTQSLACPFTTGNKSCNKISNFKEATSDKLEKVGKGEESNTGSYSKL